MTKPKWLDRALVVGPYFTLCTTEQQFHGELRRLSLPREDWGPFMKSERANATCHFFRNSDGERCAIVCIKPPCEEISGIQVAAMLTHEAVHIYQDFCLGIGEDSPSDEFEAYSIQTISQRLMEEYARQVAA